MLSKKNKSAAFCSTNLYTVQPWEQYVHSNNELWILTELISWKNNWNPPLSILMNTYYVVGENPCMTTASAVLHWV